MDIDLAICKANISTLELQAVQQSNKLEWMQQELHSAREEKENMETSIEELTNQIKELTTKLESGAVALKALATSAPSELLTSTP